ncbi:hypothetical protein GCM10009792_17690 [Microcella alkalica]|uniref:Ornithine cyclodeaminase/alanine dehydrogenase-like protein (Mu-crystallin family) n=1 Tax=Microcella alkalica TaxID=355930 RepID=A0A839E8K6_9MICO|nr:hypothetical protein [Microcella alkalica]MBA8847523.1 ornithine cyclodeaminase/alanine dehydrogenase-like protein (mu-crystallin family) [Microcella alkalica]
MIGTGRNAMGLLEAAAIARPINNIRVYGRNKERLAAFVATANGVLDVPVTGSHDLAEALDATDIVFVSTDSTTPVLSLADVPGDCLVAGMGVPSEFDDDLYLGASTVVVASKDHERGFGDVWHGRLSSSLVDLDASGRLPWDAVIELAQLIDAAEPARSGVRVFRESSGGYGDIALAAYIYDRAVESGRGQRVRFA